MHALPIGLVVGVLVVAAGGDVAAGVQRSGTVPAQQAQLSQQQQTTTPVPVSGSGQRAAGSGPNHGDDSHVPPRPWWQDEAITKELVLTRKQVQAIDKLYESNRASLKALYDEKTKAEAELDRMIREGTVEESVVALQLDRVEAPRTLLNKTQVLMFYKMHRVLTPEQNQKLQAILDRNPHGRRGGTYH
jgi:Spy/CpxP family protein refolding chaperone